MFSLNSKFAKNVITMVTGTGLAQALPFLATPLLTRLFTEEDFAIYTSFFAIATIFAVGAGGKYHMAIVLPKSEEKANKLFILSLYLTVAYTLLIAMALPFVLRFFPSNLSKSLYYVPLFVLFFGIWSTYTNLSIRHKTFKVNAFAKVLQSVGYIIVALALGVSKVLLYGLVLAKISGTLSSWLYLAKRTTSKLKLIPLKELKEVAKTYIDYPKYGIWPAFLNTVSLQALVLILTKFYTTDDLGYFGLTFMVLSAPLGLIGTSFKDVFYQKMADLMNNQKYTTALRFFKKSALALFVIGLPICIVLYFFGESLFAWVFGEKWGRSGEFAAILAFSFLIKLVVSPLSSIFNATNTLRIASRWQVLYFVTTFITLGYAAYILKLEVTRLLVVYVIHEIILYGIYFWWQHRTVLNYTKGRGL